MLKIITIFFEQGGVFNAYSSQFIQYFTPGQHNGYKDRIGINSLKIFLNPYLNKINIPPKVFFIHSAEKQSGPVQDWIFIYPRRLFSSFWQSANEVISSISNPTVKFVCSDFSIIHKRKNEKPGF